MKNKLHFRNLSQKDVDKKALSWDASEIILPELFASDANWETIYK